tara:strand:+ start:2403 stop:2744 length:342 start_codon:yes stop_codon:yes gene_type:complete
MEILVEEQDNLYCVCVKVEPYNTREKRKTIVNTKAVAKEMRRLGYTVGPVVQDALIHNQNGVTQGTWFFEKKQEKSLDKPAEEVIIEKEKPAPAKQTRRRRSKSSTKKVSSEE